MDQHPKILIVEDQFFVAIDSEMTLRSAGFDCVGLATDAQEALALARDKHPDLVVMDIRIAGRIDGVQLAADIYRELGIRSLFASGHADARIRQEAQEAHPLGWINKPYSGRQLLQAVDAALGELRRGDASDSQSARGDLH